MQVTKQQFAESIAGLVPDTPVVMGAKGDYFVDSNHQRHVLPSVMLDCSGTGTWTYFRLAGVDLRDVLNAQGWFDKANKVNPAALVEPEPGDIGLFGADDSHIDHIVYAMAGGHFVSADGARHDRQTLAELARVLSDTSARLRLYKIHPSKYRADFRGWRSNPLFQKG